MMAVHCFSVSVPSTKPLMLELRNKCFGGRNSGTTNHFTNYPSHSSFAQTFILQHLPQEMCNQVGETRCEDENRATSCTGRAWKAY